MTLFRIKITSTSYNSSYFFLNKRKRKFNLLKCRESKSLKDLQLITIKHKILYR